MIERERERETRAAFWYRSIDIFQEMNRVSYEMKDGGGRERTRTREEGRGRESECKGEREKVKNKPYGKYKGECVRASVCACVCLCDTLWREMSSGESVNVCVCV